MNPNIEVQEVDIELFEITEDGSIYIEKDDKSLYSFFDDQEINLTKPYKIEGLTISQNENKITLETEAQLSYFQEVVKVNVKEINNDQPPDIKSTSAT